MNTLRSSLRAAAVAGLVAEDLDRHPERAEARGEGLRPGPGDERRRAQPVARDHAHEGDVGELRAGRRDDLGDRALERGARRVEVGVDLARAQSAGRLSRGLDRGGGRRDAEHDVAAVDRRARRRRRGRGRRSSRRARRVEAAHRDAGGDELCGEDAPGLAEAEQGDGERRHLREGYLSRVPEVFAPAPGVWSRRVTATGGSHAAQGSGPRRPRLARRDAHRRRDGRLGRQLGRPRRLLRRRAADPQPAAQPARLPALGPQLRPPRRRLTRARRWPTSPAAARRPTT